MENQLTCLVIPFSPVCITSFDTGMLTDQPPQRHNQVVRTDGLPSTEEVRIKFGKPCQSKS
jgi:hypothetical protein